MIPSVKLSYMGQATVLVGNHAATISSENTFMKPSDYTANATTCELSMPFHE